MKKRYLFLFIVLMFQGMMYSKALIIGDCDAIVSYKLNSSQDQDSYICRNKEYQTTKDSIYYKKNSEVIRFNDLNIYSMHIYSEDITLEINGKNSISLLHVDSSFQVIGKGSLKFKEGSFVKKVTHGEPVYKFMYKNKVVLLEENQPYVGTLSAFVEDFESLQAKNKLPVLFLASDYEMIQELDYEKMTSVPITTAWLEKNVKSSLQSSIVDGYGFISYIGNHTYNQLESDDVILLMEDKIDSNYALVVNNLDDEGMKKDIEKSLDDTNLVSLYDVSVYKGKKEVEMKDGNYTVKIKLQDSYANYSDYQIIYINDTGIVEEYIDAKIEDDYIVFSTSHLSQYGIIAKEIDVASVSPSTTPSVNKGFWLKVVFLLSIVFLFVFCITLLAIKTNAISKKKKRR